LEAATKIGFTGTRKGMTAAQQQELRELLAATPGVTLHHGDAIGADAQAHEIAAELGASVVIHPPSEDGQRAFKSAPDIRAPKPYLDRSKEIVRETEMVAAAPASEVEELRSGTWSTIRYARRLGRPVWLILPDGRIYASPPGLTRGPRRRDYHQDPIAEPSGEP
jgi:hypothetical protein